MKLPTSSGLPKKRSSTRAARLFVRRIIGDSMHPTLRHGQLVVFTTSKSLQVGDIVMFTHDGREKVKRIARLEQGRMYLLGDNPENSTDSRAFGWLGTELTSGVLVWPRIKNQTI